MNKNPTSPVPPALEQSVWIVFANGRPLVFSGSGREDFRPCELNDATRFADPSKARSQALTVLEAGFVVSVSKLGVDGSAAFDGAQTNRLVIPGRPVDVQEDQWYVVIDGAPVLFSTDNVKKDGMRDYKSTAKTNATKFLKRNLACDMGGPFIEAGHSFAVVKFDREVEYVALIDAKPIRFPGFAEIGAPARTNSVFEFADDNNATVWSSKESLIRSCTILSNKGYIVLAAAIGSDYESLYAAHKTAHYDLQERLKQRGLNQGAPLNLVGHVTNH